MAVNGGTSGLHMLIRAYGIADGEEVITMPFSFIASSNCIIYERAKPVFVDIEPDTANIDPCLIEQTITPKTEVILAVDAFGQPAKPDVIRDIAKRHGLVLIAEEMRLPKHLPYSTTGAYSNATTDTISQCLASSPLSSKYGMTISPTWASQPLFATLIRKVRA